MSEAVAAVSGPGLHTSRSQVIAVIRRLTHYRLSEACSVGGSHGAVEACAHQLTVVELHQQEQHRRWHERRADHLHAEIEEPHGHSREQRHAGGDRRRMSAQDRRQVLIRLDQGGSRS